MSAYVKELIDNEGNTVYPVSKASAIYMGDSPDTVEQVISDMEDNGTHIEFLADGGIVQTLPSGVTINTEFLADGSIKETTRDANNIVLRVKTTTFNADGSITIVVERNEEEG